MNTNYHIPVMLHESVDALQIKPNGIYADLTFGGGGHSREILSKLETGILLAFDRDEDAEINAEELKKEIGEKKQFIFVKGNFRYLRNYLKYYEIAKLDGIIADLGVSSHQFDQAERGFSYRNNALADMRMDSGSDISAQTILNTYAEEQLSNIFREYGEVKDARKPARLIVEYRKTKTIAEIDDLKNAIAPCVPKFSEYKYWSRIFQALRIEVNQEIEALKDFLAQSPDFMNKGGRMVVLSYHSLEDRLVKNFFKSGNFEGKIEKDFYGNVLCPLKNIVSQKPSEEEIEKNSRAASATLRVAEKNNA